jgi:uncharacterized lipoprotein YddW (UPF0748 family)
LKTSKLAIGLLAAIAALSLPVGAQQTTSTSIADTLPPPLPLDASGKPVAVPKSNLERADFSRAIYVDAVGPTLKSPASIRKLVQDCRDLGFDTIVAQVRAYGDAYYQSQLVPRAADLNEDFDPLKLLVDEAHGGVPRIKVHAMVSALRVAMKDQKLPPKHVVVEHRDWLTKTADGSEEVGENKNEYWLDPGLPEVQDHIALITAEIARNYGVDGIQLERVRMPDVTLQAGYNPKAVERFKAEKGAADKPQPKDPAWIEWRRNQLTELVRKTREAVKAARADVEFSASAITYGNPVKTREDFLRQSTPGAFALCDWQGWAADGIVDSIALMDYKAAETRGGDFEGWMNFALANKGKAKVTVVVGGWLNNSKLTAAMMLLPIFDPRADGVGLYSYHSPSAPPETPETAFSVIKAVLHKENVERRAAQLVDALSKPLTTENAAALVRLKQIAGVLGGGAASSAVAAAPTPPPLPGSQAAQKQTDLPSLQAAATASPQMPVLGAAGEQAPAPATAPATASLPPLQTAAQASEASSLPPISTSAAPNAPASPTGSSLPPLGAAQAAATQPEAPSAAMPSLSQAGAQAPTAPATTLPPLGQAPEATPAVSSGPAVPPLGAPSSLGAQEPSATPTLPLLTPAIAQPAQELPVATPAAAVPPLEKLAAPSAITQPSAALPLATPAAASGPGLAEKFAQMGIPTEETRGSITIPGSTGETNFGPSAVTTPAAAVPTFVPPSVLSPTPAAPTPPPVDVMALMPTPAVIDRSNTKDSPFIKATPLVGPRNYAATAPTYPTSRPTGLGSSAELIVLKNGQQFVGQVIERSASLWRIQLPNGSKIAIPANKVAQTRPVTTSGQ